MKTFMVVVRGGGQEAREGGGQEREREKEGEGGRERRSGQGASEGEREEVGRGRRKRGWRGRGEAAGKEAFEVFRLGSARPSARLSARPLQKMDLPRGAPPYPPPPQKKEKKSRKNHFRHIHTLCSPRDFSVDKLLRKNTFMKTFMIVVRV